MGLICLLKVLFRYIALWVARLLGCLVLLAATASAQEEGEPEPEPDPIEWTDSQRLDAIVLGAGMLVGISLFRTLSERWRL